MAVHDFYQLLILLSAIVFSPDYSEACSSSQGTGSSTRTQDPSSTSTTYIQCYERATGSIRCATNAKTSTCKTPDFRQWGSTIYADVKTCKLALPTGPYFIARTGVAYVYRSEAKTACEQYEGAKLAVAKTKAELALLRNTVERFYLQNNNDFNIAFWVGLDFNLLMRKFQWYDDRSNASSIGVAAYVDDCSPTDTNGCTCAMIWPGYDNDFYAEYCNSTTGYAGYALCYGEQKSSPPGISQYTNKYFIARTGLVYGNRDAAKQACEVFEGAKLAVAKTPTELNMINQAAEKLLTETKDGTNTAIWVGLDFDSGTGKWEWYDDKSDSSTLVSTVYTDDCEPTVQGCTCGMIWPYYGGDFYSEQCNSLDGYYTGYAMCYGEMKASPPTSQNSGKYFLAGDAANGVGTYDSAKSVCIKAGGRLATIWTKANLLEVISLIGKNFMSGTPVVENVYYYWINLKYDQLSSKWKWEDANTIAPLGDVTYWSNFADPSYPEDTQCVTLFYTTGEWLIDYCDPESEGYDAEEYGVICMK